MNEDLKPRDADREQDLAWVGAFLEGDRTAFDRLVLRHKDRVFNLCWRLLGDREEANEQAQEVFVRVFRSIKDFRFKSSFSTWLYAIAVNTCRNRLKSSEYRRRRRMVSIDALQDPDCDRAVPELRDPSPSVLDRMTDRERDGLIQSAIDSLPEESRTIVVLRDIEGIAYEEIAAVTRLNLGTVKSRLARARQQLRDKLKGLI
ncbi:sigma-70 family RNA polymerase sigma factor [Syntrophobacter fumaroxidans]|uniref:RNA polymerase, sigma-24 subunit, ECF subfamily n=1 Tax=Syntrophobacter fumaroxidans (strain DSM 10017 / MPOB) TaxID=335543 RepID=A0LHW6_SYNFM|nr:sigma-70 family RNA polymerase sigma factor [Syntrophobacter fumaroxidans]ABK17018.1 RNA polymerase, sigma-24 subunit, ECF subfamily [Syntrophobacter fumaroxidans MPOB]